MLGPYIKSRGTRGSKMSANADLITVETYVQQGNSVARDLPPTGSEANTIYYCFSKQKNILFFIPRIYCF